MSNTCTDLELTPEQAEAARRANLVPQLRERSEYLTRYSNSPDDGLMSAAADEIERLRTIVRSVTRIISQNENYRWKVERIVAALGERETS